MGNDGDLFGNGTLFDGFIFLASLGSAPGGDKLFVGAMAGPSTIWNTTSLPTDYSFLSQMSTRFSAVSLEVPGEGDANDITLGQGTLDVRPVPEPASLTLTALGLAGVIARGRRRQRA